MDTSGRIVGRLTRQRFADAEEAILAKHTDIAAAAERRQQAAGPRKLLELADWADIENVEDKLLRRAHTHCKRYGLTLLSHKFRRSLVEKIPAVICTIVVEQADARAIS